MRTVKDILQDADPLHHEAPRLELERERVRHRVIAAASEGLSQPTPPFRRPVLLLVAVALIGAALAPLAPQIWSNGGATLQAAVRFEVRLAEERPGTGLTEARRPGTDRVVYLHRETVVTNEDVARSNVVQGSAPSRFGIVVQFTEAGAEKMRLATANHIGRPVAVLIDGAVVIAPVLRAPIGASATISGDYTQADAERIVNGIGR